MTGGASGLRAATARMLVASGSRVAIADMNREAGEALATELGPTARFILTDVADEASGRTAVDTVTSAFGAPARSRQLRRYRAGGKVLGKAEPPKLTTFAKVMQINLIGAFNMIRTQPPPWRATRPTRPANVASSSIPHRWPPSRARSGKPPMRHPRAA